MTNSNTYGTKFTSPSREELLEAYRQLYETHPHDLVPLETQLPVELRSESRDKYRIIMMMILSQGADEYELSMSFDKLFSVHSNMGSFVNLSNRNDAKALLKRFGFPVVGPAEYSADRFWCLVRLYFDK